MAEPVQGTAFIFYLALTDSLNPDEFIADPTIASGDFQISIDGSTYANLTNLPVVDPSGSVTVQVSLTATEMTGDNVIVKAIDATGDEWGSALVAMSVPTANTDTLLDIAEGDRIESATSLVINKKDTTTALISKTIGGSAYNGVEITTKEP